MKTGNDPGPVAGAILFLLMGPLIWAGHLFLVYGPQSGLCAFWLTGVAYVDPLLILALVGGVTAVSVLALAIVLWRPLETARLFRAQAFLEGDNGAFIISVMRLLAALSLAGVVWAGATALILAPCAQLR